LPWSASCAFDKDVIPQAEARFSLWEQRGPRRLKAEDLGYVEATTTTTTTATTKATAKTKTTTKATATAKYRGLSTALLTIGL